MSAAARTDVVLVGVGTIGRALLRQLASRAGAAAGMLRVAALVDRSGWLAGRPALSRRRLAEAVAWKAVGRPLAALDGACAGPAGQALAPVAARATVRPILVDLTAVDTTPLLGAAFALGYDVVLANKLPLAAAQEEVDRLRAAAHRHGGRLLHEATVGAGLPVIDTLRRLQRTGDRVLRVEGCPSGTLGYLFGALGQGRPFSAALRDAMAAGYTEPDPRADLSGLDVARKALILARLLGFRGELADVAVESLVPPALRELPLAEFLGRVGELDTPWSARVAAARRRGCVLRYRARVTPRAVTVGLAAVPARAPLGALEGTDNQFALTTTHYRAQPLVITGPGAGPAVTAAGVLGDILRIVAERGAVPAPRVVRPPCEVAS